MTGDERPEAVTDPAWEAELRAGQEADGGAGSVEPELAIARLLLHARAPAELVMAREDAVWADIHAGIAPVPWWRSRVLRWGGPALAAAAAVVLVMMLRPDAKHGATGGAADLLEQQFSVLAPAARTDIARNIDGERGRMRGELIAMARSDGRAGQQDQGGAP
jgi:hypothetical protein